MRYRVFYGTDSTAYAVCYGATEDEAQHHFREYNPCTTILRAEEFPDPTEPDRCSTPRCWLSLPAWVR